MEKVEILGDLKEWVFRELDKIGTKKEKREHRKMGEKLWRTWMGQGHLATDQLAPLPTLDDIRNIQVTTESQRKESQTDWEKSGKHGWGFAYKKCQKELKKQKLTRLMCELMIKVEKAKSQRGAEGKQEDKPIPTGDFYTYPFKETPSITTASPSRRLHPVLPPPYGLPQTDVYAPLLQAQVGFLKAEDARHDTLQDSKKKNLKTLQEHSTALATPMEQQTLIGPSDLSELTEQNSIPIGARWVFKHPTSHPTDPHTLTLPQLAAGAEEWITALENKTMDESMQGEDIRGLLDILVGRKKTTEPLQLDYMFEPG